MTGVTSLVSVIEKSAPVGLYHEYSHCPTRKIEIHLVSLLKSKWILIPKITSICFLFQVCNGLIFTPFSVYDYEHYCLSSLKFLQNSNNICDLKKHFKFVEKIIHALNSRGHVPFDSGQTSVDYSSNNSLIFISFSLYGYKHQWLSFVKIS